jgi:hypothetical protein
MASENDVDTTIQPNIQQTLAFRQTLETRQILEMPNSIIKLLNQDSQDSQDSQDNSHATPRSSIDLDQLSKDAKHIVQDFKRKEQQLKEIESNIRQTETELTDIDTMFKDITIARMKLECEIVLSNITSNEDSDNLTLLGNSYIEKLTILQAELLNNKRNKLRTLERRRTIIEENLNALRKFILLGVKEIVSTEVGNEKTHLCPICFINEVSLCLEPCGHTVCGECSNRVNYSCMVCRKRIDKKIRLYFSA